MIKLSSLCTIKPRWNALAKPLISRSCSAHILTYGYVKDMYEQLGFNREPDALKPSRPGAAAHMSLHLDQQCQRAQTTDAQSTTLFQQVGVAPEIW